MAITPKILVVFDIFHGRKTVHLGVVGNPIRTLWLIFGL